MTLDERTKTEKKRSVRLTVRLDIALEDAAVDLTPGRLSEIVEEHLPKAVEPLINVPGAWAEITSADVVSSDYTAVEKVMARKGLILAQNLAYIVATDEPDNALTATFKSSMRNDIRAQLLVSRRVLGERDYLRAGGPEL